MYVCNREGRVKGGLTLSEACRLMVGHLTDNLSLDEPNISSDFGFYEGDS